MENIKASDLQAAVSMTAALVLNDGKYEQWQKLFGKALNDATTLMWKDKGWSEFTPPRGKNAAAIHRLTFTSAKPSVILTLSFDETTTGYIFLNAFVDVKGHSTETINGRAIANGKDLLATIVSSLEKKGSIAKQGVVIDPKLKAEALRVLDAAWKIVKANGDQLEVTGLMDSLPLKTFKTSAKSQTAQLSDLHSSVALDALPEAQLSIIINVLKNVQAASADVTKSQEFKEADAAIDSVETALEDGEIGRAHAVKALKALFSKISYKFTPSNNPTAILIKLKQDMVSFDVSKLSIIASALEDIVNTNGVSKPEVLQLLQKVKRNCAEWAIRDVLLRVGDMYIDGFDYVSLDEATAKQTVDKLYGLVRDEEISWDATLDIYDQFEHMQNS